MKFRVFLSLLTAGEGITLEYKRKVNQPEKIAKEICAFANTKGGVLIIGIDDDGTIVGIKSEKTEIEIVEQTCAFYLKPEIIPEIQVFEVNSKDLLCVTINEGKRKPYEALINNGEDNKPIYQAFVRVGENSVPASSEMKRLLKKQTEDKPITLSIGDKEKRLFSYLEKYNRATVNDFSNLVNISRRRAERLMIRLVQAGVLQIHTDTHHDYFTLIE